MTVLRAEALTFGYRGQPPLLDGWSEQFRGGEVVAITGPSGRGKSTLLYILGLMHRARGGRLLLDGEDCGELGDARRARLRAHAFGFVFQDAALDATRSVLDNVLETSLYRGVPRSAMVARARQLLDQFDVEVRAEATPGQVPGPKRTARSTSAIADRSTTSLPVWMRSRASGWRAWKSPMRGTK